MFEIHIEICDCKAHVHTHTHTHTHSHTHTHTHTQGDHNLLIPIHAYPVMNTAKFPQSVTFPPTPIGQTRSKTISLRCDVPINFEYELSFLQIHPAFNASPMKGWCIFKVLAVNRYRNCRTLIFSCKCTPTKFNN